MSDKPVRTEEQSSENGLALECDSKPTNRKHVLSLAVDSRALTEFAALVFLDHLGDAAIGQDESGVDQTVEHFSRLLDQIRFIRVIVQFVLFSIHEMVHRDERQFC